MLDLLKTSKAAEASTANGKAPTAVAGASVMLPLRQIADNPYQPRGHYDAEHILNLALSIRSLKDELPATKGLQQIPMARVGILQADGEFDLAARHMYANGGALGLLYKSRGMVQLMFGHSRLRAFMVLAEGIAALRDGSAIGMDFSHVAEIETRYAALIDADLDYAEMPIAIGFAMDHQMWAHAITENSQRKNITAIEEAVSIQRAVDEFGLTTEEAGRPFGYARSTTANKMRLLQLPEKAQQAIADGRLSERHGRELLRLADDPEQLQQALDRALSKGATVRQLASDVEWRERVIDASRARQAELDAARAALVAGWTLPGQREPVPAEKLDTSDNYASQFDPTDVMKKALIEGGHCGPGCSCFVMTFRPWAQDGYRPDPEKAPHVMAACSDYSCCRAKLGALPTPDAASPELAAERAENERRRSEAEAINNESRTIWQRWQRDVELSALWGDLRFWVEVTRPAVRGHETLIRCEGPHDAVQKLLTRLYRCTRSYNSKLNAEVHNPDDVVALIERLGGSVSRETGDDDQ